MKIFEIVVWIIFLSVIVFLTIRYLIKQRNSNKKTPDTPTQRSNRRRQKK